MSEVLELNLKDLLAILKWNLKRGIRMFRIGSSLVPFAGHAQFDIEWQAMHPQLWEKIRILVATENIRLSMHPGQYTILNTPSKTALADTIKELEWHAQALERLAPGKGTLVLHVGGVYDDKKKALFRFQERFPSLPLVIQNTLCIENDDKSYNALEVLELCKVIGRPMIFDIFHHKLNHSYPYYATPFPDLLEEIMKTWEGINVPKLHLSTQKSGTLTGHDDIIWQADFEELLYWMDKIGEEQPYDVMLEAKHKERALLKLTGEKIPLSPKEKRMKDRETKRRKRAKEASVKLEEKKKIDLQKAQKL